MKAQDYVDKYLPLCKEAFDKKEADRIVRAAFGDFCYEVEFIAKSRNTKKDKCVLSIIKEVGQKWNKFARLINDQQENVYIKPDGFIVYWNDELKF